MKCCLEDRLAQLNQVFGLFRGLVYRVSWEANPEGKGVRKGFRKGWMFFKKEVLKGAVAGHPHGLKEEPAGKTTPARLNRALHGTPEKNGIYDVWKNKKVTQED